MSDNVYADFGVTNAVFGSEADLTAHQQEMLSKDVMVRDGDDAITFESTQQVETEGEVVEETTDEEVTEGDDQEGADPEDSEGGDQEFQELGATPKELTESVSALEDNEAAFEDMVSNAVEAGTISSDDVAAIKAEYAAEGALTDASYEKLQKAGYSRRFVDSFVRGQEALAEQYAAGVVRYAGGAEQFNRILSHLESSDKETRDALEAAIVRKDLSTAKAIINLAGRSLGKTKGVQPQRTVTQNAKPAVRPAPTVKTEGYSSKAEMVKAMSDRRYLSDREYTMSVRQKVAASSF